MQEVLLGYFTCAQNRVFELRSFFLKEKKKKKENALIIIKFEIN